MYMRLPSIISLSLVFLAGCGSREEVILEGAFPVPLAGITVATWDSPKENSKIQISGSAPELINVYLFREGDEEAVKREVLEGIVTAKVLKHVERTNQFAVDALLPGQSRVAIFVSRANGKPTNANLRVTKK